MLPDFLPLFTSLAPVMKNLCLLLLSILFVAACDSEQTEQASLDPAPSVLDNAIPFDLDAIANEYLLLELSMGLHDGGHVDAYFGDEGIRILAEDSALSLDEIKLQAENLADQLANAVIDENDAEAIARIDGLLGRLLALDTRIMLNQGETLPFDEESRKLFGSAAPDHDDAYFQAILDEIDALVGGDGELSVRVNNFQDQFVVPPEKLPAVFDAAIAECRRRTLLYINLPANESFTLEYVNDKPWSGYNWYQGNSQSLIQINTDLPIFISRAVDLGCHEGYPGHHTFNTLLEKNLVRDKGWAEFSLYPLFSPQSLIAEGSGNYGIDLAFPGRERIAFEKEILFPLAGLDVSEADRYYELQSLLARLNYAGNEAARDYLDGRLNREEAVEWMTRFALSSPERALQRTEFIDTYRTYVINYNLGKDIVREYIERDSTSVAERWQKFEHLLSSPMTLSDLQ